MASKQEVRESIRSRDLIEIKSAYMGFVRTAAGETQVLEKLELRSAILQHGGGL